MTRTLEFLVEFNVELDSGRWSRDKSSPSKGLKWNELPSQDLNLIVSGLGGILNPRGFDGGL